MTEPFLGPIIEMFWVTDYQFPREDAMPVNSPVPSQVPNATGRFGPFGGRFVPETLTRALDELAAQYDRATGDASFQAELDQLYRHY